jgi:hypothetical protein
MPLASAQLLADRDQWFADWGEPITFREVAETFDPETLEVSQDPTDTALTAIIGEGAAKPAFSTAGQHLTDDLTVVIKAEELPTTDAAPHCRIVRSGVEYDVVSFDRSAADLVYALRCRRR